MSPLSGVHDLVGATVKDVDFTPIWKSYPNEGVALTLTFTDGRVLEISSLGDIDGSSSLEVIVT